MSTQDLPDSLPPRGAAPDAIQTMDNQEPLAAVRQRLDWLFRHAQPTAAMDEFRQIIQQHKEAPTP